MPSLSVEVTQALSRIPKGSFVTSLSLETLWGMEAVFTRTDPGVCDPFYLVPLSVAAPSNEKAPLSWQRHPGLEVTLRRSSWFQMGSSRYSKRPRQVAPE